MSKLDVVLREEIRRVVRRELKASLTPLAASNKRLRQEVRLLRDELASRAMQDKREKRAERVQNAVAAGTGTARPRWNGPALRTWREKYGLSGVKIAALLGVSSQTLYNWEQGKSKPDDAAITAVAGLRALGKRDLRDAMAALRTEATR